MKQYSWLIFLSILVLFFVGRYFYFKPDVVNGEKAKGFKTTLINGQPFELQDLRGDYVLIDFWGSWCYPCRKENPRLVELYEKYKSTTFENAESFKIVSVAIEVKESSWKKAIRTDHLRWPYHIFDKTESLRFFDSKIANLYGIKEVPTTFLVDPNGIIVGTNMPIDKIDEFLTEKTSR